MLIITCHSLTELWLSAGKMQWSFILWVQVCMFHQQWDDYCEIQHEHLERMVVLFAEGGLIFSPTFLRSPENGWTVLHLPCQGPQFRFPPAPTSPGCSSYSGTPTSTSLIWVVCQSESLSRTNCCSVSALPIFSLVGVTRADQSLYVIVTRCHTFTLVNERWNTKDWTAVLCCVWEVGWCPCRWAGEQCQLVDCVGTCVIFVGVCMSEMV